MVLNYSKRPYTAWGWPGPVSMVRTILSGVKHTLGTLRGNKCFFTSSLLPFSVLTPPPLLAGFLLALLSVDYWLIPPSPIGTTQGLGLEHRGEISTQWSELQRLSMYGHLYSPHLLYLEITTECHSLLVVFPAGILGYMPKPGMFFLCNNTVHRVCLFKQTLCFWFSLNANICVCLCKHQLW